MRTASSHHDLNANAHREPLVGGGEFPQGKGVVIPHPVRGLPVVHLGVICGFSGGCVVCFVAGVWSGRVRYAARRGRDEPG